jgi:hypothetical protein
VKRATGRRRLSVWRPPTRLVHPLATLLPVLALVAALFCATTSTAGAGTYDDTATTLSAAQGQGRWFDPTEGSRLDARRAVGIGGPLGIWTSGDRSSVATRHGGSLGGAPCPYRSCFATNSVDGVAGSEFLDDGARMVDQPFRSPAYDYATSAGKLDHIFVPKHNLDGLVSSLGSREAVIDQMLAGIRGQTPAAGLFEIPTSIGGQTVVVRGAVVDGVVKLGTAFTR